MTYDTGGTGGSSEPRIHLRKEPRLEAKCDAFAYQREAVLAVRDLEYAGIFHEQGLGKTKIAIDLMLYWLERRVVDTVLLIVKKSLLYNWRRELAMHAYIKPRILSQNRTANYYTFNSPARLVLAHYEVLSTEAQRLKLFAKTRPVGIILDESAKIKNPKAALTQAALELAPYFRRRVIMTGTPIANRPEDIWAQVYFLDQGESLGKAPQEFRRAVCLSGGLASDTAAQLLFEHSVGAIFARIGKFCIRETKNSGVVSLPDKEYEVVSTEWEPRQEQLYRSIRDELRAVVVQEGVPRMDEAGALLKRLLRLVQVASNPKLVDQSYNGEPGKLSYLRDIVWKVRRTREKCIVWTSFTDNADWLAKELKEHGARRVHGKLGMETRNAAIESFMGKPEVGVLVATPGAAKEGLTLTAANHVIFYDRTFGLDDYLQAQDRIHRISQTRTCYVHNLIMPGSIDEWVDALLDAKHLAAQLAQGDISLDYYKERMRYDFGEILANILSMS